MHESLAFTNFLNHVFGASVSGLLQKIGFHAAVPGQPSPFGFNTAAPFNDAFALELAVVLVLIAFFVIVRLTLNVENPGPAQFAAESIHDFVGGQADQIIGHGYERYQPFVTSIFLFVLCCNLLGLYPGFETPTADPKVPLGIALLTFLYYNYHGLRVQGPVNYTKHFLGPIWWISWLMFPIEIISHLARIMSLTIRLFANMFASDLLTLVFFSLIPIGIPIVFLGLHLGVAFIQAYVFMLLAMIYLTIAVSHEEEAH
jgi:F-type H+-transporting ATPase subunit a